MRGALLTMASLAATGGLACLNDIDTTRIEKQTSFEVRSMVAGRYEVNPPAYYEARIKRLTEKLMTGSQSPSDYDDLAVAYERLGQTDKAITTIGAKGRLKSEFSKDDEYRTHANLGTFLAHKALSSKKPDKALLKRSLTELEKALTINPDAHFGREAAQIELVRALLEGKDEPKYFEPKNKAKNAYFGLVVMGAAQESPDVWVLAARHSSYTPEERKLIYNRIPAFLSRGKKFYFPALEREYQARGKTKMEEVILVSKLTENGAKYQAAYTKYVSAKLAMGLHPDTDPTFWKDYREVPLYKSKKPSLLSALVSTNSIPLILGFIGAAALAGLLLVRGVGKLIRRG